MKSKLTNLLAASTLLLVLPVTLAQAQDTSQTISTTQQDVIVETPSPNDTTVITPVDATTTAPVDATAPTEPEKIKKNQQSIRVTSNPEGAKCTIVLGDETLGVVPVTPADIVIKRTRKIKFSADVTCEKPGFDNTTYKLLNKPSENAIDGNIGAIFTVVKALEGSLAEWEDSIHVKLKPSYFATTADRDAYFDAETATLNAQFTADSKKYLTCEKKKCKRRLAKLQTKYDEEIAVITAEIDAIPIK